MRSTRVHRNVSASHLCRRWSVARPAHPSHPIVTFTPGVEEATECIQRTPQIVGRIDHKLCVLHFNSEATAASNRGCTLQLERSTVVNLCVARPDTNCPFVHALHVTAHALLSCKAKIVLSYRPLRESIRLRTPAAALPRWQRIYRRAWIEALPAARSLLHHTLEGARHGRRERNAAHTALLHAGAHLGLKAPPVQRATLLLRGRCRSPELHTH